MNQYQPNSPYRLVDVRLACPADLTEEQLITMINGHLSGKMQREGKSSFFVDWMLLFRGVKYSGHAPKDGDLFAFLGANRVKQVSGGWRSKYKVVIRYTEGSPKSFTHRSLDQAEARVHKHLTREQALNASIYEHIPQKRGRPLWKPLRAYDSEGKVVFDRNSNPTPVE